jgi:hypothetical protein
MLIQPKDIFFSYSVLTCKQKSALCRKPILQSIYVITINAPLISKMRDIIFFLRANYIMGHFKGYFEGAKTFLTPKLSRAQRGAILGSKKSRPPRNIPRNGPLCSLPKTKKNNISNFQKSAVHCMVFLCPFATRALNFITLCFFIFFLLF